MDGGVAESPERGASATARRRRVPRAYTGLSPAAADMAERLTREAGRISRGAATMILKILCGRPPAGGAA